MSTKYDFLIRLLLIGDSSVGKTSILSRYADDTFSETYINTVGIDFRHKTIPINGMSVRVQVWDTAGQERFRGIMPAYYRGIHGVILVYDMTNPKSFHNIQDWIMEIDRNCTQPPIASTLLANKSDLEYERKVTTIEGHDLASMFNLNFHEVSALKDKENIDNAFISMITKIATHMQNEKKAYTYTPPLAPVIIKDENITQKDKKGCSGCMACFSTKQQIKGKIHDSKFQNVD